MTAKKTSNSVLQQEVLKHVDEIDQADILVGIPSFRSATTIRHVIEVASEGMTKYFSDLKPVLVNSDGGSEDRTRDVALATPVPPQVEKIVTPYLGPAGKGSAFKTIFEIADRLQTKVCIVVDSDLRSITPEWISYLGEPVWKHNFGFVAPYYVRYKYDGTITNSLAYPLTRALYGVDVRQPIGGEFGLCGALTKVFSHQRIWDSEYLAKFGIDIWMTTTAICEGFKICQASMGVKLHDAKDPSTSLGPMFRQVVATMFSLMKKYEVKWKAVRGSQPIDLLAHEAPARVEPVAVNLHDLMNRFKAGFGEHRSNLKEILALENFERVEELTKPAEKIISYPNELWARTVYDFAVAYNFGSVSPEEVVEALIPLYFGWTASFILKTEVSGISQAESLINRLADAFEGLKPYLIEKWDKAKTAKT